MEYWIWLKQISGIGTILEKRLLDRFPSPQAIYEACAEELLSVEGIGPTLAKVIRQQRSLDQARTLLEGTLKQDINLLTYHDPLYPAMAQQSSEAPTILYYKGKIRENSTGVAIVGSRRCTDYGKQAAVEAAYFLTKHDIPVISGMAKGIDGYAHTACLKAGGYTIALLGNGVDICYPKEHDGLLAGIIENGAVISAYPPGTRPRPEYFPERNELISSWSHKVFVVEAGENGGALITAGFARAQGKEVHVLPHEILNPSGKGNNRLIAQGAHIYLHPSQLLPNSDLGSAGIASINNHLPAENEEIPNLTRVDPSSEHLRKPDRQLSHTEQKILSSLSSAPKTIEKISADTQIDQLQLIQVLSLMELEGLIRTYPGGRFV
ncbi:MAG: DNA-processing protein DprA [Syntrophomonadaceae bacterium]